MPDMSTEMPWDNRRTQGAGCTPSADSRISMFAQHVTAYPASNGLKGWVLVPISPDGEVTEENTVMPANPCFPMFSGSTYCWGTPRQIAVQSAPQDSNVIQYTPAPPGKRWGEFQSISDGAVGAVLVATLCAAEAASLCKARVLMRGYAEEAAFFNGTAAAEQKVAPQPAPPTTPQPIPETSPPPPPPPIPQTEVVSGPDALPLPRKPSWALEMRSLVQNAREKKPAFTQNTPNPPVEELKEETLREGDEGGSVDEEKLAEEFSDIIERLYSCEERSCNGARVGDEGDFAGVRPAVEAVAGVRGYCDAQRDLLTKLDQEADFLVGIWDAAVEILKDKRGESDKADRLFGSTAQIAAEVGVASKALRPHIDARNRKPSIAASFLLGDNQRKGSVLTMLRKRSEVKALERVVGQTMDYTSVLRVQGEELDELQVANIEYDSFMADCLKIQAMMFNDDDLLEEVEQDMQRERTRRRSSRFSLAGLLPSTVREKVEDTGKVTYDHISAAKYMRARRSLMKQLKAAQSKEQEMMQELARVIGLEEREVVQVDVHAQRERTEEWVYVQHLPKDVVASDAALSLWMTATVGTPDPADVYVNQEDSTALVFFPSLYTHEKAGRLLYSFRALPIRVHSLYPCRRCYALPASIECAACDTWMCRFCNRLLHEAQGLDSHEFSEKKQV